MKGKCPKCGGKGGFEINSYVSGWWKVLCWWNGEIDSTDLDGMKFPPMPKTVICLDCGKRVSNPLLKLFKEG